MQPAIAFENGRPVLAYDPRDEGEETGVNDRSPPVSFDPRADRLETISRLIELLSTTAVNATECGRNVALISYLLRVPGSCKTQRHLADYCGLSLGAVNKVLKRWRSTLGLA